MREVEYTDKNGYLCVAMVRDEDPDSMAPQGIPLCPPDLSELDWDRIKRDVHNELVRRRLLTWKDVERSQTGITAALQSTLRREIVTLYRLDHKRRRADQRRITDESMEVLE